MAPSVPTQEPVQFVAGDTVSWTRTLSSYPSSDGWTLHYNIVGPSAILTQPVVTVVNGQYSVTLVATATADVAFAGGTYRIMGWVTNAGGERHTIFSSNVEILPNAAVATWTNLQTFAERMLAAIESVLEGRVTGDIESYTIDGTSVTRTARDRLLTERGIYAAIVWREQNPGKLFPTAVGRFVAPGSGISKDEATAWPGYQP